MTDSPFASTTFTDIWLDSFRENDSKVYVEGIDGVCFFKARPRLYINLGQTHTKGLDYTLKETVSLKGNTILIHDVPSYFGCPEKLAQKGAKLKKIRQYPGFLIELDQFKTLQEFMQQRFKKSSRYKLNKYFKRLTACFNITSVMYWGEMDQGTYEQIFEKFRTLLEKRFQEKGEYNNNLDTEEWNFYKKVAYPMILKKEAGLFVVYDGNDPIAITLNYFSKDIIFDAITVFDTDYAKFHLGSVNIMFLIQWGIENGFKILDFSKGYFDYKVRWATQNYDFEYHIFYDPKSILSTGRAYFMGNLFKIKQYLREKNLNLFLNKLRFALKGKTKTAAKADDKDLKIAFEDVEMDNKPTAIRVDGYGPETKKAFFEFLYLYGETADEVVVYKTSNQGEHYIFEGKQHRKLAVLT